MCDTLVTEAKYRRLHLLAAGNGQQKIAKGRNGRRQKITGNNLPWTTAGEDPGDRHGQHANSESSPMSNEDICSRLGAEDDVMGGKWLSVSVKSMKRKRRPMLIDWDWNVWAMTGEKDCDYQGLRRLAKESDHLWWRLANCEPMQRPKDCLDRDR